MIIHKKLLKLSLQNLKHISCKIVLKYFLNWRYSTSRIVKRVKHVKKMDSIDFVSYSVSDFTKKKPSSGSVSKLDSSELNTSDRLYYNAQEIEQHKREIRENLKPKYSFTPTLSTGTLKWLRFERKKDVKENEEEVAVVSGSRALDFSKFSPGLEKICESNMPLPRCERKVKKDFNKRKNSKKIVSSYSSSQSPDKGKSFAVNKSLQHYS